MNQKKQSNNQLEIRFRELISETGLPLRFLPDLLSLKAEKCLSWWAHTEEPNLVRESHFCRLSNFLGMNEHELYLGGYDKKLARKRVLGDSKSLPERYQVNQHSFIRTSAHIIEYLKLTRGQAWVDQILASLNMPLRAYENPDMKINLTYFADLLSALAKNGFSQNELDTLSSVIFLGLKKTELGKKLSMSESSHDVYKTLADSYHYFDSNFEYKSSFIGKKYILKTTLPLDQHSLLVENPEDVARLMRYRHILLAWFPYLAGLPPVFSSVDSQLSKGILRNEYVFEMKPRFMLQQNLYLLR